MSTEQGTRRVTWSPKETKDLIRLIGQQEIRGGKIVNAEAYQQVSEQMLALGYKKTSDQCKIKWKHLKNFYYEARRKKTDQERFLVCPFFNEIRDAIGMQSAETYSRWCVKEEIKRRINATSKTADKHKIVDFKDEWTGLREDGMVKKPCATTKTKITEDLESRKAKVDVTGHVKVEPNSDTEKMSPIKIQIPNNLTLPPFLACPRQSSPSPAVAVLSGAPLNNLYQNHGLPLGTTLSKYNPGSVEGESISSSEGSMYLPHQTSVAHAFSMQALQHSEPSTTSEAASSLQNLQSPRHYRSTYIPEVCIKWNSYQFNMQTTLPTLLDGDKFVDVTLACEGRYLKCHKLILSACSKYFEELLSQAATQYPIIFMKDVKFWQIQAIIEFMYRGEVNIAQERLPSLLAAAEALRVKGLAAPTAPKQKFEPDTFKEDAFQFSEAMRMCMPSKRGRKRKHSTNNGFHTFGGKNPMYEQLGIGEGDKTDKENLLASTPQPAADYGDATDTSKLQYFLPAKNLVSNTNSCITTIILPDHDYQQNTLCKVSEGNQEQPAKNKPAIQKCDTTQQDFPSNELKDSPAASDTKNHHDHIYSKPQKEHSDEHNENDNASAADEDVSIHDNTIFYSYLQIGDSTPAGK